jgi:hypothetical protein
MKSIIRFFKKLLCSIPSGVLAIISLIALIALVNFYGNIITKEVNGLTWGVENELLTGKLQKTSKDDIENIVFTLLDIKNNPVFTKKFYIDRDIYGAGFVRAIQVDDDPELEVVFYTNRPRSDNPNFYIDIKNGKVETNDFSSASLEAKQLAEIRVFTGNTVFLILVSIFLFPIITFMFFIYKRYFLPKPDS